MNQHEEPLPQLARFLRGQAFVLLCWNRNDPSKYGPFEAWAYQGPLDLQEASPVTFGVGEDLAQALTALDSQIESCREEHTQEPEQKQTCSLLRVSDRDLATILAALRFHQEENLQGTTAIPDQAIRDIATDCGRLEPLSFEEIDDLCQRLNVGSTAKQKGDRP